jgi:hypothetical protein
MPHPGWSVHDDVAVAGRPFPWTLRMVPGVLAQELEVHCLRREVAVVLYHDELVAVCHGTLFEVARAMCYPLQELRAV